jgi:serralysin
VTGSDYRLELDEALMHQDLNGDGVIGINGGTTIEADGSTSLVELNNNFFLSE